MEPKGNGRSDRVWLNVRKPACEGTLVSDPGDSLQIGADTVQPVGDYEVDNCFEGCIANVRLTYGKKQ